MDLVRVGRALGQNPSVICLETPGTLAAQVEALGVPVLLRRQAPRPAPQDHRACSRAPAAVEARRRPHPSDRGADLCGPRRQARERVPVVVHTEHINNVAKHRSLSRQIRIRLLWGLAGSYADRFFCVSDDIADAVKAYRTVPGRKVVVVPNGIDTAAFATEEGCESLRRDLGIPHRGPRDRDRRPAERSQEPGLC